MKEIDIESGVTNRIRYVIDKCGVPHLYPDDDKIGDHIVKFKIEIPKSLSTEQQSLILRLKEIEKSQGLYSNDLSSFESLSQSKYEYIHSDKSKRFWEKLKPKQFKSQYSYNDDQKAAETIFSRFKSMFSN